jgi:hypothetical protein
MKFIECDEPRNHLIIDDFFLPDDLERVWAQVLGLEKDLKVGLQSSGEGRYSDAKKNRNLWLDYDGKSGAADLTKKYLWHPTFLDILATQKCPSFGLMRYCHPNPLHVSSYGHQDHYKKHVDTNQPSNLTVVIFLCKEPKSFTGGNFVLEFDGKEKVIQFKNNRALIFPSDTQHSVTDVNLKDNIYANRRFSLQMWPKLYATAAMDPEQEKATQRIQKKAREEVSYYVPRFAIKESAWGETTRLLKQLRFRGKTTQCSVESLFEGVTTIRNLALNLKYISSRLFSERKCNFNTEFASGKGDANVVRVYLTFKHQNATVFLGYEIEEGSPKAKLSLFVRKVSSSGSLEKKKAISHQFGAEQSVSCVKKLSLQLLPKLLDDSAAVEKKASVAA